jgi:alcohol dehydrogenase class IV
MTHSFSFPTHMVLGEGALQTMAEAIAARNPNRALIVTDRFLVEIGIVGRVTSILDQHEISHALFADVHPNPLEEDCDKGIEAYNSNDCDLLIAIGGGSAMDVAKVLKVLAAHSGPIAQYDDAMGGDRLITEPMPPLYAIPTTSGTGSEVGRAGVVIVKDTGRKTVIFHSDLMPDMAVLEPSLTQGLPPHLTAATGIDALTHALEAYFAPDYHPICDGIAVEAIDLVVKYLPMACKDGNDLQARERMQLAASMGAIAFQKGLGMVHSLAHPLSAEYDTHHGLANALLLPDSVALIEDRARTEDQLARIRRIRQLFADHGYSKNSLAAALQQFVIDVGITPGLSAHGVPEQDLEKLSRLAYEDGIHKTNMVPVTQDDLLSVYCAAFDQAAPG